MYKKLVSEAEPRIYFIVSMTEMSVKEAKELARTKNIDIVYPIGVECSFATVRVSAKAISCASGEIKEYTSGTLRLVDIYYEGHSGGAHSFSGRVKGVIR